MSQHTLPTYLSYKEVGSQCTLNIHYLPTSHIKRQVHSVRSKYITYLSTYLPYKELLQIVHWAAKPKFNNKICLVLQLNFECLRLLVSTCSAHTCVPGCPDDVIWWIRVTGQGVVQDGQDVVGGFDVVGEVLFYLYRKVLNTKPIHAYSTLQIETQHNMYRVLITSTMCIDIRQRFKPRSSQLNCQYLFTYFYTIGHQ